MRSIQTFASNFFVPAISSKAERSLVENIVALDGFRTASLMDLSFGELQDFVKIFSDGGYTTKRRETKAAIFGKREVKVHNTLFYHNAAFRGAFAYVPSYKLGFFAWSIKTHEPFGIPISFFDNIQRVSTGSPFDEWLQSFPACSGVYRDGVTMCKKARQGLSAILKAHPTNQGIFSQNKYDLNKVHSVIISTFESITKKDVKVLHLHETMNRSIQVTKDILSSRFDLSEITGLVLDSENDLLGYFAFSGGDTNHLSYFSFYDEQGEKHADDTGQTG